MKQGVLLVNLGSIQKLTPTDLTAYLTEFLLDKNVVDLPHFFWKPLLTKRIIPKRLPIILDHYAQIWIQASDQSPLIYYSESLVKKLNQQTQPDLIFDLAMTYGEPNIKQALQQLIQIQQCDQIIVLPLYPQYSTTTTLPVLNQVKQAQKKLSLAHDQLTIIPDYYDHPAYIEALFQQIETHFQTAFRKPSQTKSCPDVLLLSYHGIPLRYIKKRPEPYVDQCQKTTQLLAQKLIQSYPDLKVEMSFQSRFGKGKWTTPNTSDKLIELAQLQQSVAVICPGFAVDCLETLHEIKIENRALYLKHHGTKLTYIPALNDSTLHIKLILELITPTFKAKSPLVNKISF